MDIETRKEIDEVGGWSSGNIDQMGFGVGCAYLARTLDYRTYFGPSNDHGEGHLERLFDDLERADLVIGFNLYDFDYKVLQPYANKRGLNLRSLPTFDILDHIERSVGRFKPVGLEALGSMNLGYLGKKTLDPKEVVDMYKSGYYEEVTHYCRHDVFMTRLLFMLGYYEGKLSMRGKRNLTVEIDCSNWKEQVKRRYRGDDIII